MRSKLIHLVMTFNKLILNNNRKVVRIQYPDVQIPGPNTTDKDMVHFKEISLETVCHHVAGEDIRHIKFDPVDVVRAAIYMQLPFWYFKTLINSMGRIKTPKWASIAYIIFYHYASAPYSNYDFVHFVDDWIIEKFGFDPKALENLPFVGFKLEHSTTLR